MAEYCICNVVLKENFVHKDEDKQCGILGYARLFNGTSFEMFMGGSVLCGNIT